MSGPVNNQSGRVEPLSYKVETAGANPCDIRLLVGDSAEARD